MIIAEAQIPNFENIFNVAADHQLLPVRSRSRGGAVVAEFWEHEEFDPSGRLLARYESYEEIGPEGSRRGCWRKFDSSGRLVKVGGCLH